MTEVNESTRSGWSMERRCTIIPPIDQPITCARSTPSASTRRPVVGHVGQGVVGSLELGGEPDVAIVEPDDVEPFVTEELTPLLLVVQAL